MTIVVSQLDVEETGAGYSVFANVRCDGVTRRLAFSAEGNHPRLKRVERSFDPFAVALLIPAMERGEDLVVEGQIDARLVGELNSSIQAVVKQVDSRWRRVSVQAERRIDRSSPDYSLGAATGMSCGVDSLFTASRYCASDVPEEHQLRVLFHNHVGAHGLSEATFLEQRSNAQRFADSVELPLVSVTADLSPYYRSPFIKNHILRNAAAALAAGHLFHTFHHSAGQSFSRARSSARFSGIGAYEGALLPLLSTRRHEFRVAGNELSRVEKTASLLAADAARRHLTVCIRPHRDRDKLNCGCCYKCGAFLIQAEAAGRLDAFRKTFDVDAFLSRRGRLWFRLLRHSIGDRRLNYDIDLLNRLIDEGRPLPSWIRPFKPLIRTASR